MIKEIKEAIKQHFDGLAGLDTIPRTKQFLQLDCLAEDIEKVEDELLKPIIKRIDNLEKRIKKNERGNNL